MSSKQPRGNCCLFCGRQAPYGFKFCSDECMIMYGFDDVRDGDG